VRTLVVSDLHLGARTGRDVLRREHERRALTERLDGFDRLVLLGDLLELRQGPVHEALSAAAPALRELGQALGPDREVIVVAGNHDHHLVAAWFERRFGLSEHPGPLGLESAVDWEPSDALAAVAGMLEPAAIRAVYPGTWLRDDVYATHGHYLDRHTTVPAFERIAAGAMARVVREDPGGPRRAEDYEAVLSPVYAWIHAIAQTGLRDMEETSHGPSTRARAVLTGSDGNKGRIRRIALLAAFPALLAGLNRARIGPLRSDLSGPELRRAGLRAFGEVLGRLDVHASHVIFGHTHRAGPLPRDEPGEWRAPSGAAVLNTGSWIHEPTWIGADPKRSPYRPGFAAIIADDGPPELVNLLD
jgi:Calcineurin-like phosphoesterase